MSVSIVIPTFNRPGQLRRLLDSIASQTYPDYEIIVVDDCSATENSYTEIVCTYSEIFRDFSYLRNDMNRGAPYSRNRGIREAKNDLIALVDDDDEWLSTKLQRQIELLATLPKRVGLVYTWADVIEHGKRVPLYRSKIEGECLREILTECFIPSPSVLARKQALIDAGLFDEQLPSCQDWDMWTRIFAVGYESRVVCEVLALYHKQKLNSIGTSNRAGKGYSMYYRKHFWLLVRFWQWRHLIRLARLETRI